VAVVRFAGGILLALLVSSVRRGTRLSRAMEARGLGSGGCRTVARVQRMRSGDWAWIAGSLLLATAAIGLSLALGTWRPLIG
jgi:energy-coupling factor transport system permease protein